VNFSSVETCFKTGIEFQEAGNFEEAIASYQQVLKMTPHQPKIYQKLAEVLVLNGQLEAGIKAIQTAINLQPNFAVAYLSFGNILQQQNQIDLAIWAYTQALDLQPNFTEARANLGSMYYHLGRFSEAIHCYQQAISLQPDAAVIYWMLGNAFYQTHQLEQAISCYQKAIDLEPKQAKFYLKLANILTQKGQKLQAISYYQTIIRLQPDCSEAIDALAQLTQASVPSNFADNLTSLTFLSESNEQFEEGGVDLASPLSEATEPEPSRHSTSATTEEIFVETTEPFELSYSNFPDLQTYRSQANLYCNQGQFEEAIALCQQALKIQPNFLPAYVTLGNSLHFQGKLEAAIRAYSQALELQENLAEVYGNRGTMYAKLDRIDEAIADYQKALELQPNLTVVHWNLGKIFQRLGRLDEAASCWQTALEIQPNLRGAKLQVELGNLLKNQKKFREAISCYQKALEIQPNEAEAYVNLGCLYSEQKNYEAAIQCFQTGIKLNPHHPDLYLNLGFALVNLGRTPEAMNCYQTLLQVQPDTSEAYASLGNLYSGAGQVEQAIKNYEQAIKIKPDWAEIYCRLAHIQKQDQPQAAIKNLEKAIELNPNYIEAHQQLCDLLSHSTNLTKARKAADQYCQQCGEKVPVLSAIAYIFAYTQSGAYQQSLTKLIELERICQERIKTFSLFEVNLLYEILIFIVSHVRDALVDNANLYKLIAAEYYQRRVLQPLKVVENSASLSQKPLKIGFISKHFRRHSVGWCSEAIIRELSAITPHVHLYVSGRLQADAITEKFEQIAHKLYWPKSYPNGFASAEELAQEISQDQIDILIDLDSVTVPANVQIFNYSPAPVCLTWLGFDAPYITDKHYFLCDWNTHPAGREQHYREKLIRLPETSVAISGLSSHQVNRNIIRKQLGIDADKLVYLCVAPGRKTNFEMIEAQVKIMKAVPDSLMIRKGQGDHLLIREMYHQACEEQGVDFNRILFIGLTKTEEEHRAIYQVVDVLLDSYPYNGGTHNLEALWSNLPILTRAGEQYLSRMGYAFLQAVHLDQGIAWSWEEYTEIGIKLGRDANLRTQIREHLIGSKQPDKLAPLWNPKKLAQEMYKVFEKLRFESH
jgi:predicted O-linked N-acetylglucosamine transferase (SPINDLY family)